MIRVESIFLGPFFTLRYIMNIFACLLFHVDFRVCILLHPHPQILLIFLLSVLAMDKICISVETNYSISFICGFSVLSYLDRPSPVMKLLSMLLTVLPIFDPFRIYLGVVSCVSLAPLSRPWCYVAGMLAEMWSLPQRFNHPAYVSSC